MDINQFHKLIRQLLESEDRVTLSSKRASEVVSNLPSPAPSFTHDFIFKISGMHDPCPTNVLRRFTDKVTIMKSSNGKKGHICCFEAEHVRKISKTINDEVGPYGYEATPAGNQVDLVLSNYATASVVAESGYRALYCNDNGIEEELNIGVGKGMRTNNIRSLLEKAKGDFRKEHGSSTCYPDKIEVVGQKIPLPLHVDNFDPEFIKFIIDQKPNLYQFQSYETLYQLYTNIPKSLRYSNATIIRIISNRTGLPIPTVRKHIGPEELIERMKPTIAVMLSKHIDRVLESYDVRYF